MYYAKNGRRGIWKRPVDGGDEIAVTDRGTPNLWAMHDRGVCIVETEVAAGGTVDCLDFEADAWRTVAVLPASTKIQQGGPSLTVSPDGQWILYVVAGPEESDIMLATLH